MKSSDAAGERAALLAQVAAYLEWEQKLGGAGIPQLSSPKVAPAVAPFVEAAGLARENELRPSVGVAPTAAASRPVAAEVRPAPQGRPAASAPPVRPLSVVDEVESRAGLAALAQSLPVTSVRNADELRVRLAVLDQEVRGCTRCELHKGRTHTVFARGNPEAKLVFVGEGPGQEEDKTGQPFVGPAGQLLDKMVGAMGLARDDVYICNVVKCRPPGNRTPLPSEAGACASYLLGQIDAVRPQVIVALGRCAAENMGLVAGGSWRGRWGSFREVPVMPTYHPAFLLRSPEYKRPVWEDLQKVMAKLRELA